jgi:hypothetical protein
MAKLQLGNIKIENISIGNIDISNVLFGANSIKINNQRTYNFIPSNWGIVEGVVSDTIAKDNRTQLQSAIDYAKDNNYNAFNIGTMDAYFYTAPETELTAPLMESIWLPSNFHLIMSNNTHIRMQPHRFWTGHLIRLEQVDNVRITGGNLHGDRYTHDYSPINDQDGFPRDTHEFGVLLLIQACHNVVIDGIYIDDSSGDALVTGSIGKRYNGVDYNQNILIKNSTFTNSRRNNVSFTDGADMTIDNCIISDAGQETGVGVGSWGTLPKTGIDIEPFQGTDETGTTIYYEKVERVTINNCTFTNNYQASILDYAGIDCVIQNNTSDHIFSASYSTGTQFLNNTMTASLANRNNGGIEMGNWVNDVYGELIQYSKNNVVSGNTISGFTTGIIAKGEDGTITNNTITDFVFGIEVRNIDNGVFSGNNMESYRESYSIGLSLSGQTIKNATFTNEICKTQRKPMQILDVNDGVGEDIYTLSFNNCDFESQEEYDIPLQNTPNITLTGSILTNTSFAPINCANLIIN